MITVDDPNIMQLPCMPWLIYDNTKQHNINNDTELLKKKRKNLSTGKKQISRCHILNQLLVILVCT